MSLLQRLKAGTKNSKKIKFPGTEEEITLRVLSTGEAHEAHLDTERMFNSLKIEYSPAIADLYEDEKSLQQLFRALSDSDGNSLAKDIAEFRNLITKDERDVLVDEYLAFESECSPNPPELSSEEFDRIVEAVKKRPEEITGNISNILIARQLIIFLVNRLATLQRDSGSIST